MSGKAIDVSGSAQGARTLNLSSRMLRPSDETLNAHSDLLSLRRELEELSKAKTDSGIRTEILHGVYESRLETEEDQYDILTAMIDKKNYRALQYIFSESGMNLDINKVYEGKDRGGDNCYSPLEYALKNSDAEMISFIVKDLGAKINFAEPEASDSLGYHFFVRSLQDDTVFDNVKTLMTLFSLQQVQGLADAYNEYGQSEDKHSYSLVTGMVIPIVSSLSLRVGDGRRALASVDKMKERIEYFREQGIELGEFDLDSLISEVGSLPEGVLERLEQWSS